MKKQRFNPCLSLCQPRFHLSCSAIMCHVNTMDQLPNLEYKPAIQRSDCGFERRKTFAVEMNALARSSDIQRSFLSGAGGGTRTHTSVTPTDFESASSTIPTHRHCCVIIQHGTRKFKKKLPKLCHFSNFICSLRCLQSRAREAAMFSFWTRMWSGTFRCLGA